MPPKSDLALLSEKDQFFLVECIKNAKEKFAPDFEGVAQATDMSKKGASNKFRDIMKRFEAGGATLGKNSAATTKPGTKRPKATATKKPAVAEMGSEDGEDEENDGEEVEPPKKKANTAKAKAPAKRKADAKRGNAKKKAAVKLAEKVEEVADGEEVDDDDDREDQDGELQMEDEEESV